MAYETLKYEVLKKEGPIEIRTYQPFVTMTAKQSPNDGFNLLFQYISGQNTQNKHIKMTVPVLTDIYESDYISFTMPEKDIQLGYPKALNDRIIFKEHEMTTYLSYHFIGSIRKVLDVIESMTRYAQIHQYELIGTPKLLRYQGPFVPPILRKYDVIIEIKNFASQ
jgi:hypothetical protein